MWYNVVYVVYHISYQVAKILCVHVWYILVLVCP